jgi:enoyl-CoA hydratase
MAGTVELTVDNGLGILRLGREHGNAINPELAEDLSAACAEAERDSSVRGLLLAASGKLFCPGLDLQDLIELDRSGMERFVASFADCVLRLYTVSKPMVAALHGHALAGGCVLALTADWRILRRGAMVGLNEVRVGVPFPYGVAMLLRESVPRSHLEEVALFGRNYSGEDALAAGLVHEVIEDEGFEARCLARLEELAERNSYALAVTCARPRPSA